MASMMIPAPRRLTDKGEPRRIGVELEFAGLDCAHAAAIVRETFGGHSLREDPYRYHVEGTCFGRFTVELDSRYAHARELHGESMADVTTLDSLLESLGLRELGDDLDRFLRETAGEVGQLWLPVEIVAPPIPLDDLPHLDRLVGSLRAAGAEGSREGLVYAFGLQLNPEMPDLSTGTILRYLQAYLVLAAWLRETALLDRLRQLLPFAQPFPQHYALRVLGDGYRPDLPQFIDDYLSANPTRNRELDLLPLFAHLDQHRVRRALPDAKIKARPTLHWRLPDSRINEAGWGIVHEWNRWILVEKLAEDESTLAELRQAYRRHNDRFLPGGDWNAVVQRWVEAQ